MIKTAVVEVAFKSTTSAGFTMAAGVERLEKAINGNGNTLGCSYL